MYLTLHTQKTDKLISSRHLTSCQQFYSNVSLRTRAQRCMCNHLMRPPWYLNLISKYCLSFNCAQPRRRELRRTIRPNFIAVTSILKWTVSLKITPKKYKYFFYLRKGVTNVCPRSLDTFYIVSFYIKWVKTSWTYSILC